LTKKLAKSWKIRARPANRVNRAVIVATAVIVAHAAMAIASAAVAVVTAARVVSVQKVAKKAAMPTICPLF
jgi:hypothetical protein